MLSVPLTAFFFFPPKGNKIDLEALLNFVSMHNRYKVFPQTKLVLISLYL